jgi:hypothetical protein
LAGGNCRNPNSRSLIRLRDLLPGAPSHGTLGKTARGGGAFEISARIAELGIVQLRFVLALLCRVIYLLGCVILVRWAVTLSPLFLARNSSVPCGRMLVLKQYQSDLLRELL